MGDEVKANNFVYNFFQPRGQLDLEAKCITQKQRMTFLNYVNPKLGKSFFPLTLHTGVHTHKHACSVEQMSEWAARHATAPNKQC